MITISITLTSWYYNAISYVLPVRQTPGAVAALTSRGPAPYCRYPSSVALYMCALDVLHCLSLCEKNPPYCVGYNYVHAKSDGTLRNAIPCFLKISFNIIFQLLLPCLKWSSFTILQIQPFMHFRTTGCTPYVTPTFCP
jgi:hypothetical protein